jgi:hypothetical protein
VCLSSRLEPELASILSLQGSYCNHFVVTDLYSQNYLNIHVMLHSLPSSSRKGCRSGFGVVTEVGVMSLFPWHGHMNPHGRRHVAMLSALCHRFRCVADTMLMTQAMSPRRRRHVATSSALCRRCRCVADTTLMTRAMSPCRRRRCVIAVAAWPRQRGDEGKGRHNEASRLVDLRKLVGAGVDRNDDDNREDISGPGLPTVNRRIVRRNKVAWAEGVVVDGIRALVLRGANGGELAA